MNKEYYQKVRDYQEERMDREEKIIFDDLKNDLEKLKYSISINQKNIASKINTMMVLTVKSCEDLKCKTNISIKLDRELQDLKSYIVDMEKSFQYLHINHNHYKQEIEDLKMQIKALEFKSDVEEASKNITEKDWNAAWVTSPVEDKNIIMKHEDSDVPPWTGYYDVDRYIAHETRLPIMVSHWKYVE